MVSGFCRGFGIGKTKLPNPKLPNCSSLSPEPQTLKSSTLNPQFLFVGIFLPGELFRHSLQVYRNTRIPEFQDDLMLIVTVPIPRALEGAEYELITSPEYWVAVKELNLSYYIGETLLFTVYTHYSNLI